MYGLDAVLGVRVETLRVPGSPNRLASLESMKEWGTNFPFRVTNVEVVMVVALLKVKASVDLMLAEATARAHFSLCRVTVAPLRLTRRGTVPQVTENLEQLPMFRRKCLMF